VTSRAQDGEYRTEIIKVRVTPTEMQWLREFAEADSRSVSSAVRLALRDFYNQRMKTA
jgi:hypothetical protein